MDSLAALRLQIEWGADEALDEHPRDHFLPAATALQTAPPRPAVAPAIPPRTVPVADTLDALHAALSAFEGCALRATATTTVRPDGNPTARLVLIAEAPGADDDRLGTAFAGAEGAALDHVLRTAGLGRDRMLLTHLVPWRPPGARAPSEAEIQACLPFLLRLLQLVLPGRLVLLGASPAKVLAGGGRRVRGRWTPAVIPGLDAPLPALQMPPWSQWMGSPAAKRDCWADLLALRIALDADG